MEIERQRTRYYPQKGTNYYDLNITLSEYLDIRKNDFTGKNILDIGAGEIPFKEFYRDLNVTTSDIQNNSTGTIDHIIVPDVELPFNDASFDVIFLFDVLEHIKNDSFFLSECNRILTENGILIASIPFMYRFHEIPYDYSRYTPSGLTTVFEAAKFELVELKNMGSVMFTASTFLMEHQVYITNIWRKIILKGIIILLKLINVRKEISEVSPFSFFCVVRKMA